MRCLALKLVVFGTNQCDKNNCILEEKMQINTESSNLFDEVNDSIEKIVHNYCFSKGKNQNLSKLLKRLKPVPKAVVK